MVHFLTDLSSELMLHYGSGDAYNKLPGASGSRGFHGKKRRFWMVFGCASL